MNNGKQKKIDDFIELISLKSQIGNKNLVNIRRYLEKKKIPGGVLPHRMVLSALEARYGRLETEFLFQKYSSKKSNSLEAIDSCFEFLCQKIENN